ncbi:TPA: hypothetical protein N0F65_002048 [Lagenidium giganteum]|uniref:non-specific serine/threonine protein kinase n=1 Tax=Lagenidium giganteum TaxID=4803 RepID=A0AAV2ZA15_9STRA|nr:TPA: hypothetical protein N0F65_002048 [Lagenidium giganteum]
MSQPALRINSVGFIGSGRLAERIARKLIKKISPQQKFCYEKQRLVPTLQASDPSQERRNVFSGLGFTTAESNNQILNDCDLVFIATNANEALEPLAAARAGNIRNKLFVSLMGDLPADHVGKLICPGAKVIRMMPNNYLEQKGLRKGVLPPESWAAIRGSNVSNVELEKVIELAGISSFVDIDDSGFSATLANGLAEEVRRTLQDDRIPDVATAGHPHDVTAEFHDQYELKEYLGEGHYSEVYRAVHKATGQSYAVKCVKDQRLTNEAQETLTAEVAALNRLKHPNIITHHGFFSEGNNYYLVLDYCQHGSLVRVMNERGALPEAEAKHIIRQVLSAVNYCHEMGHVHRDIKADNVLITEQGPSNDGSSGQQYTVKLADFGLSEELQLSSDRLQEICGTPQYLSPEIVSGRAYGRPADIWSIGILSYMLLSGRVPFDEAASERQLHQLIRLGAISYKQPEWQHVSRDGRDFVQRMLDVSSKDRATAAALLRHPWMQ